ncbi:MAG: hypothetical protein AB1744_15515, partial [Candidatus Zixiibacteriota bacterium]
DGDNIGDTLSNGIDTILITLLDRTVSGHHPDNIDEFWQAWFGPNPMLGHGQAMMDIWYEHGEIAHCCNGDGLRGNVDGVWGPVGDEYDVADLTFLVGYLFKGGAPPPCVEEANADGVIGPGGPVDGADLTYLVAHLFQGGAPPAPCP